MQFDALTVFLSIRDTVLRHAAFAFRHVRCPHRREDYIAEALGLVWKWNLRLVEKGKDARTFPTTLALFATRAVKSGRKVCGARRPKDALCPIAQALFGFVTGTLPAHDTQSDNPLQEALLDNTRSAPPDQVAFRLDFPAWRLTHSLRNRTIIDDMAMGERTLDLSQKHKISPSRISQLRREFHTDWLQFTGEAL